MIPLVHQRCLNHAEREAVARCPECKRYFCRECVSEHDTRALCTACLRKLLTPATPRKHSFAGLGRLSLSLLAVVLTWFFFFLVGQALLAIPDSFHKGSIWKSFTPAAE